MHGAGTRPERLFQGDQDEIGIHRPRHPPADHPAGEHIHDEGRMDETHPGRDRGEVSHPKLIGRVRLERTVDPVNGPIRAVVADGDPARVPTHHTFKAPRTQPWTYRRGVTVQLDAVGAVIVQGNAGLLHVLLRNLVDNAVRYGPKGATVTVRLRTKHETTHLDVIDQGPGIRPLDRETVLQRFHRLDSFGEGWGLGLSIVARIVELHGAHLNLEDADPERASA